MPTTRPIDARGWLYEAENENTGAWLRIAGIKTFKLNPGEGREVADTVDFDSGGEYEEDVMQRGGSLSLEGHHEVDPTTGAQDPGQAYVDNDWSQRLSTESHNRIRFRHQTQTQWVVWDATVSPGEQGGGNNDKSSWSATFKRSGTATSMAV
jgi:hypothetical protein